MTMLMPLAYLPELVAREVDKLDPIYRRGRVIELLGPVIKAVMPRVKLGELCALQSPGKSEPIWAEVVGFVDGRALLTPITEVDDLSADTQVIPLKERHRIPVGPDMLGQVLDGMGRPLQDAGVQHHYFGEGYPVYNRAPNAMLRPPIRKRLETGVRAIDGLLTCGIGQRIGVFSAAGVGKSTLLATLMRNASADVCVLALIGERGREVREFLDHEMTPEARQRTVVVVATSDKPAMQRVRAAYVATAIAEYFRDSGRHVLLLMDSVTRFARALREVGLAAGEPPTRRGFPASTFSALPGLLERAGPGTDGAISAIYTVLVEGDDMNEPVADEVRSLVDGHIVLSRDLATANHYPAIDVLQSRSRVMEHVASPRHTDTASRVRQLMAKYQELEMLILMGEYKAGTDPEADEAIRHRDAIKRFLCQGARNRDDFDVTLRKLAEAVNYGKHAGEDSSDSKTARAKRTGSA